MPSTPLVKFDVSAGQRIFCIGFDSRQLHREDAGQAKGLACFFQHRLPEIRGISVLACKLLQQGSRAVGDNLVHCHRHRRPLYPWHRQNESCDAPDSPVTWVTSVTVSNAAMTSSRRCWSTTAVMNAFSG